MPIDNPPRSLFPYSHKKVSEIPSWTFEDKFPEVSDVQIAALLEKHGIDRSFVYEFKWILAASDFHKTDPSARRKQVNLVRDAAEQLQTLCRDQTSLEILFALSRHRANDEKHHTNLIAELDYLISVADTKLTVLHGRRKTRHGSMGHLIASLQRFLCEIERPYHRESTAEGSKCPSTRFIIDALHLLAGKTMAADAIGKQLEKHQQMLDAELEARDMLHRADAQQPYPPT